MSAFRILVVDDSPAVCRLVELAVGCDAVQVAGAADAHAALAIVNGNRLDLAIVATAFTGLAGYDLIASLSSQNVPVALMTGSLDQTGVDTEAATAGVLIKPLGVQPLRDLVSATMNHTVVDGPAAENDPIESWLSEADARLGFLNRKRRGREPEAQAMDKFERDVSSLRQRSERRLLDMKPSQRA